MLRAWKVGEPGKSRFSIFDGLRWLSPPFGDEHARATESPGRRAGGCAGKKRNPILSPLRCRGSFEDSPLGRCHRSLFVRAGGFVRGELPAHIPRPSALASEACPMWCGAVAKAMPRSAATRDTSSRPSVHRREGTGTEAVPSMNEQATNPAERYCASMSRARFPQCQEPPVPSGHVAPGGGASTPSRFPCTPSTEIIEPERTTAWPRRTSPSRRSRPPSAGRRSDVGGWGVAGEGVGGDAGASPGLAVSWDSMDCWGIMDGFEKPGGAKPCDIAPPHGVESPGPAHPPCPCHPWPWPWPWPCHPAPPPHGAVVGNPCAPA